MNDNIQTQKPEGEDKQKGTFAGLGAVVILLAIGGVAWFFMQDISPDFLSDKIDTAEPPSGAIFLSLILSPQGIPLPIMLDASSGKASDLPLAKINKSDAISFQLNLSYADTYTVFLGTTKDTYSAKNVDAFDVYLANTADLMDGKGISSLLESAKIVSKVSDDDYFRIFPVVSEMSEVLYSSLSKKEYGKAGNNLPSLTANDWNIYLVTTDGSKTILAQGLYPKWINDKLIAFIKNDGVYIYDFNTNKERLVWKTPQQMNIVNGFDVSDGGEYFAVTSPAQNNISLVKVVDWKNKVFSSTTEISLTATNPLFSHDNKYLAIVVSWQDKNDDTKVSSGIEYYSIVDQKMLLNRITINQDLVDGIYLTEWK